MSTSLVDMLMAGEQVNLIHRSKIIGIIEPKEKDEKILTREDVEKLYSAISILNLPKTTRFQRKQTYLRHIIQKYG
ncbi:MAG: hypothetical protein UR39_C0005G0048 [Candidatus Woesebacteria bacterium GW2011_GWA1_33_30]|uniref:Uncharacterized protein n=1 Tax=Candidatus Woesebacteria bacterium GW2011_GWA2_33_28 TaxID=1618561 RepID=A0A0G0C7L5_9BACT|nr:MAG: hypothetical protein UR38_C0005G0048 [Candidatus Woesebacteria bacterium GW2011_GWA2_33_28]KKP48166.1 MAG: hypothetical protein UR39_C0005G0048 [Candidatus Woesebacteria bacterium GW2011_GWA1_33_30]KKP49408.1 MAG: hypothetical protein UR40_C0006G0048 [Microgenomates group bacterium GW2011_GWC1_33_32]KKP52134.1 MAG: hypothetical protein UR44_C0004G0048 [Candidatus Woesebacteria bacterium GW2011_GWB1_33_38]